MKLPVQTEFITHNTPSRLGTLSTTSLGPPSAALPVPAQLAELDAKDEGGALDVILDRDSKRKIQSVVGWKREDRVFGAEGKMSVSYISQTR